MVRPETPEEIEFLRARGLDAVSMRYPEGTAYKINCRRVTHVGGNPHDDGLDPRFVELVQTYKLETRGYPELLREGT
ncbi:MAG: hypothetical protein ACPLRW_07240 [Moorellales bacterium]